MRLLLDTHIFIWFVLAQNQLSTKALTAIQKRGKPDFSQPCQRLGDEYKKQSW